MRRLITISLVLLSLGAFAQTQQIGAPNTTIEVLGKLIVDSSFWPTLRDTNWTPATEGAITFWTATHSFYGYQNSHWQVLGGPIWGQITGTLSNQTDLIDSLNARQRTLLAGFGIKILGTTISVDTSAFRKVDTVYGVNDSTVGFKINGISYSFLMRGNAGGGVCSGCVTGANNLVPLFNTSVAGNTLSFAAINQAANTVFVGPPSGGSAAPTFRYLVTGDLPTGIPNANLANSNIGVFLGSVGTSPNWSASSVNLGGSVTLNIPTANGPGGVSGILSSGDWTTFNNKVTSVNGLLGVVVTKNADSIKKLPIDTTSNRNGYFLAFDSLNHKWYLAAGGGGGGGTTYTIGALDGVAPSANAATISGSSIYLQSASGSFPGVVNNTVQTFSGNKTFTGSVTLSGVTSKSWTATDTAIGIDASGKVFKFVTRQPLTMGSGLLGGPYDNTTAVTIRIDSANWHSTAWNNVNYWVGTQPMTTVGDMIYEDATPTPVRLPGNTTSTLKILSSTGTGAAANPPVWYVPVNSDVVSWLGFTPYNSTNPAGYLTIATLPALNFVDGLHARDSAHAALGGKLDTAITTINGRNLYAFVLDSMQAGTNRGFKLNVGSDAGWDLPVRDSATGFMTRIPKGSVGQVLTMLGSGGIGWGAQAGGGGGSGVGVDSVVTITSGTSSTVTNGYNIVRINPASVMSTYTLTLPTTWHTSNDLLISFGGTITAGNPVVTTLTIVNGSGQTLLQSMTPTTANAGEIIRYHLIGTIDQRTN